MSSFPQLKEQLDAAAAEFASDAQPLAEILAGLVGDVERALHEPLELFPVCHHSPSSAVHLVRRLRARAPRVIFMEACEDLQGTLEQLRECTLPVALQAFAGQTQHFPSAWTPLSLVCPLSEFSAEFQAIAYALTHDETELVFVDRSADHVFQWIPQTDDALDEHLPDESDVDSDDESVHASAVGVEVGSLVPTFDAFREFLLKNARVQHFSEWYDQYVEEVIIGADYDTYRQVMFLIGSLFRRLGTREEDRKSDELRERYMWTRIKQHLAEHDIDAADALYICGAAHTASDVPEFGVESDALWDIPERTDTPWLYGVLPTSYRSIELQFGHPRGTVMLAEARWKKAVRRQKLTPFKLTSDEKKSKKKAKSAPEPQTSLDPEPIAEDERHPLLAYLQQPPAHADEDAEELLTRCVQVVALARKNGYLATTADSIAVYQTSLLLANMRNRRHPTAWDFRDAAVTCIEKEAVPKKRDVSKLCDMLLGGDRHGKIGYESLPPLAKDVYDRLAPLPIKLDSRTIQRALLDFKKSPELLPCSDLLWKLRYLIGGDVLRPIMGQRELGHTPTQESWDVAIGKHQGAVIQLAYEGVTVEHVLERRLKKAAFAHDARTVTALTTAEESLLFLDSPRLTEELGERAGELLVTEPDVKDARAIFKRITRLVHYYRTQPGGLPEWVAHFVTRGYSHYATLLPRAFIDRGTTPDDLAAMLQFVFTLEGLALSLGCERSELVIAVRQSAAGMTGDDLSKLALLWSAECVLSLRDLQSLREEMLARLDNELTLLALPDCLGGFLLALSFTPLVVRLTVELMSRAFQTLPDGVLMPWIPKLLMALRPHAQTALPTLLKEVGGSFPQSLEALATWQPPWERQPKSNPVTTDTPSATLTGPAAQVNALLRNFPATTVATCELLGIPAEWADIPEADAEPPGGSEVASLLHAYPETMQAVRDVL